ncbi:DUF6034 family protein, partial [Christensenellaceae bacterium OttesenSCG-928-L17]|nr:DUF6034 family protein [Christensenellaceae bacterium OttesenSCG-928-L17]
MKSNRYILLALVVFLLLTACQPTPDIPPVVHKDDVVNESKTEYILDYSVPNKVEETLNSEGSSAKIIFDAEVILPVTDILPIYILGQRELSLTEIMQIFHCFYPEAQLYEETPEPKNEIEKKLLHSKRGYSIDGERYISQEEVHYWETLYEMAPDEKELIPYDMEAIPDGNTLLAAEFLNQEDTYGVLSAEIGGSSVSIWRWKNVGCQPETSVLAGGAYLGEPEGTMIGEILVTKEQAAQYVETILDRLNIENLTLANVQKGRAMAAAESQPRTNGWIFEYRKNIANLSVPYTSDGYSTNPNQLPIVAAPWMPEKLLIIVDEQGLIFFSWDGMDQVLEIKEENTKILCFDEILYRIKNQFRYNFAYSNYRVAVTITRIELGASLLSIENERE